LEIKECGFLSKAATLLLQHSNLPGLQPQHHRRRQPGFRSAQTRLRFPPARQAAPEQSGVMPPQSKMISNSVLPAARP